MRADDEEWLLDRHPRRLPGRKRGGEVEAQQVFQVIDLELVEALLPDLRRPEVDAAAAVRPVLGLLQEQEARGRERVKLLAQVRLQPVREEAASEHVAVPHAAVLEQDPVVDPAGRRRERLGARARHRRAARGCGRSAWAGPLTATNLA